MKTSSILSRSNHGESRAAHVDRASMCPAGLREYKSCLNSQRLGEEKRQQNKRFLEVVLEIF